MNSEMKFGDKLRLLGVMRPDSSALIDKNVPTMGELGVPFIAIENPVGVLLPKGMPATALPEPLADHIGKPVRAGPALLPMIHRSNYKPAPG